MCARAANVLPNQLQYASMSVVPLCSCAESLNAAVGGGFALSTNELCTSSTGGIDSCSGDSGGPVACAGRSIDGTNTTVVAGVQHRFADVAVQMYEQYDTLRTIFDLHIRFTGIVSWGTDCASGIPGANTRVAAFSEYIACLTGLCVHFAKLKSYTPL